MLFISYMNYASARVGWKKKTAGKTLPILTEIDTSSFRGILGALDAGDKCS
jgi:hypothetical protein